MNCCAALIASRRDSGAANHCDTCFFRTKADMRGGPAPAAFSKPLKIYLKSGAAPLNHFHTWDDK